MIARAADIFAQGAIVVGLAMMLAGLFAAAIATSACQLAAPAPAAPPAKIFTQRLQAP